MDRVEDILFTCPKSGGYVSLLLTDERHLIASVNGYTYCLDPRTGNLQWSNDLPGYGTGVASLASLGKQTSAHTLMAAAQDQSDTSSSQAAMG